MLEIVLVFSGFIIAAIAMAIGIGGGILWTPLLILLYGLSPSEAITTSLFIQVIGLGSGTIAYAKSGLIKPKLSLTFFLIALPGVIIGSFFTLNLPQDIVQMALGVMALILAILFVAGNHGDIKPIEYFDPKLIRHIAPIPAFFGFIMGFLSLGISEWLIPALRSKLRMKMTHAIGTTVAMMFMLALVASIVHYSLNDTIHTKTVLLGGLGTLLGGQLGVYISQRINERLLQQSFIYLMTLIGIHLIFQAL